MHKKKYPASKKLFDQKKEQSIFHAKIFKGILIFFFFTDKVNRGRTIYGSFFRLCQRFEPSKSNNIRHQT